MKNHKNLIGSLKNLLIRILIHFIYFASVMIFIFICLIVKDFVLPWSVFLIIILLAILVVMYKLLEQLYSEKSKLNKKQNTSWN